MSERASKIKKEETGIILIEYQNDFTSEGGKLYEAVKPCMEKTKMLENTEVLVKLARDLGIKVIHCPISFSESYSEISGEYGILANIKAGKTFTKGQWGSKFYEPLAPKDNEIVVEGKKGLCGFSSTNLDFVLRQNGLKNVILCGFLTNCCVECTMRSAYERGYYVITLTDCAASTSIEAHENTFKNNFPMFSDIMESKAIMDILKTL